MIDYIRKNEQESAPVVTLTNPKGTTCSVDGSGENKYPSVPLTSEGHIETSVKYGLGNGLILPSVHDGMSVVEDIRRALNHIASFDIGLGNDLMFITFDKEFCNEIGGYPKGAYLWFNHDGDRYDLVKSLIEDNTYDFTEDPSFIDGTRWEWAVKNETKSSGYPRLSNPITVFGNSVKSVGVEKGASIISDIYIAPSDKMLYGTGQIEFTYDPSKEISEGTFDNGLVPSEASYYPIMNGRLNGSTIFCGIQAYLAVSSIEPDAEKLYPSGPDRPDIVDFGRGFHPNIISCMMNSNVNVPYGTSSSATTSAKFYNAMFEKMNSSGNPTTSYISPPLDPSLFAPEYDDKWVLPKTAIKYYPLFSNSMEKRTIFVPVKKGQFVFVCIFAQQRYDISDIDIKISAYDFANFDGSAAQ